MTQVHFTLKSEEIQSIIEYSVKDDVSKNILTTVFNQLMENQRTEYIQAKEYERTENRQSQRNGYYERSFTTRVGTLELKVPRTRDGHFSPTVFERYQRNEKALMASMLEMYVSGVSTRKVSKIVEELCGKSVSKSFVSSLTEQLEPMVNEWQNRLLSEKNYPYLMTDVLYIKVREENRVLSKSCHIAIGITKDGDREIIGFMIQSGESEETWTTFFEYLKITFYFNNTVFHSSGLNPTNTKSSPITKGRFTNFPSDASNSNCFSSLIPSSFSFNCMDLYNKPLVLKNFRNGKPLLSNHIFNSSHVGRSSTICRSV